MKVLKYIVLIVGLISLVPKDSYAQIDTSFWFAAPWVTPDHWHLDPIAFHFSTFDDTTTIRLRQPASSYDTTFVVLPNSLFTKYVDFMLDSIESKPADQVLRTGIQITSDFPITVIYDVITRAPNNLNPETYSLKGQNGIGTEFVIPFQTIWRNRDLGSRDINSDGVTTQPYQQFNVVATQDSTTIYITPRCDVVGGHTAEVTYSILLPKKGNTYTCQNATQITNIVGNNLSGTVLTSDKPVSITVSDDSVNPTGQGCFDLMGDQIVPVDVIGNEYIVNKGSLNSNSNESIFIIATENFTTVNVDDGLGTIATAMLNQGETYQHSIDEALTYVNTDKPVYLFHMSGFGCELGAALLPPLNCAGSDLISFSRTNSNRFMLNVLCPAGSEGNFDVNGDNTLVTAGDFNVVPGTGGAWLGAQIEFLATQIPVNSVNSITNSSDLFSLGVFAGDNTGGGLYHYISSFRRRVFTKVATPDTTLCTDVPVINLDGTVEGGSITGIWSVLNGSGTLNTPTSLSTTYLPTASDYAQGNLTFVLESTGICDPVSDTMVVNFIPAANVDAGLDLSFCKNNITDIPINGTLSFAAGASWSGGNGGAFGNPANLGTFYTPSPADIGMDSIELYLTSAGSFFACPNDIDTLVVYFTDAPTVSVGPDQFICSSNIGSNLAGSVSGITSTGIWTTTGSGVFDTSNTDLNGTYLMTAADIAAGSLTIFLTSTANGNCLAERDSFEVTIVSSPSVQITSLDSVCSNLNSFDLTGTVSTGFSAIWSTNGSGTVLSPTLLNTTYNISPVDVANGFMDVFLNTSTAICPQEQDSMRVIFVDPPIVSAGVSQSFCANELVQLNGTVNVPTPGGSWATTGTGVFTPSNNFLSTFYAPSPSDVVAGSVNLILTSSVAFGCVPDVDTLFVTFKDAPIADFGFTEACSGDNTVFTDLSTTTDGTINSWAYDFGDLTSSIANNPLHTYAASGTFNATLVAGSTNGCFDTITQTIIVNPVPVAAFNYGIACDQTPIQFIDSSTISTGSIVNWQYTFEPGVLVVSNQDPTYIFSEDGSYPVILTVTSALGCDGSVTQSVNVSKRPEANFSINPNPALALEDVLFEDQSTGNPITDWFWDFDDGAGGNNQNEIHNYADGGPYNVLLTVTDINGCVDTITTELMIALLPILPTGFTPNNDGENDIFLIRGGPFEAVDFRVYNNWGEQLFQTNELDKGWDGTYLGNPSPAGVYTWTFKVQIIGGQIINKTGDVTLIR